jgi:hypothetical protein
MDYESKYLKYKEKYLSLKNQYGGAKVGDEVFGLDNKKWGDIIAENESGMFNGEFKGGPIFIYRNVNGNTGFLSKRNEGQKWVAKSKPGLWSKAMGAVFGQSSDSGAAIQPPSGAAVASRPPRQQQQQLPPPQQQQQLPPRQQQQQLPPPQQQQQLPPRQQPQQSPSGAAVASRPPRGAWEGAEVSYSSGPKMMYLVNLRLQSIEYGGLLAVIAESDIECLTLLKSRFGSSQRNHSELVDAIRDAQRFQLLNTEPSRIVEEFMS